MQGSRAQKEMKRNPDGGMHTAVMPRDMYAKGGSSVYSKAGFHDDWDQKRMPGRKDRQYAEGGDVSSADAQKARKASMDAWKAKTAERRSHNVPVPNGYNPMMNRGK